MLKKVAQNEIYSGGIILTALPGSHVYIKALDLINKLCCADLWGKYIVFVCPVSGCLFN